MSPACQTGCDVTGLRLIDSRRSSFSRTDYSALSLLGLDGLSLWKDCHKLGFLAIYLVVLYLGMRSVFRGHER